MNTQKIFRWSPYYYERVQWIVFGEERMNFLSINLPPICNYQCSFCFAANSLNMSQRDNKREMIPIENMIEIIKEASTYGLKHIEISGEWEPMFPLFRSYIQSIIETASALGIHVVVFTNGSLLDRSLLLFLCQHNTSLIISIKYFDAERYNQNVGRRMFDIIRKKIHLVQEVFAHTETIDGYRIYNFWLFSGTFENNQKDNEQLRAYCDEHDIFFSLSTPIPQWELVDAQVDYQYQDALVEQYQHNSIILAKSSTSKIWFSVCGTFYYGIGINCYGDWLFDAHAGVSIGNIAHMTMSQALQKQRTLVATLFSDYHCKSYCPLRDPNYQAFLECRLSPKI